MNIYLTKYNVKNIDIGKLDADSFYESLCANIVKIPMACRRIDEQINHLAFTPHIPIMNTVEQFDAIVDLINIKKELIKLYDSFMSWYDGLPSISKKLYIAYFIKKDHSLCEQLLYGSRYVADNRASHLLKDFKKYMQINAKFNKKILIKYPLIHNLYVNTLIKNKAKGKNKGECEYDDSTDERRYSWRVQNRVVEKESK